MLTVPLGADEGYGAFRTVDYDKIPEVVGDVHKDTHGSGETSGASQDEDTPGSRVLGENEAEVETDDNADSGDIIRNVDSVDSNSDSNVGWLTFEATAYVALCDTGCTGITATGIDVRSSIYHEGERIIAVDPSVIPLGSRVEVNVNGESFISKAADTGGAIKGRKIDVLVATESEAWAFGRQDIEVRILN